MAYDGTLKFDTALDSKGMESGLSNLGKVILGSAAFAAIAKLTQAAIDMGSSFEAAMSEVAAISGATGADFEALSEKAKYMGATTKFSASESAEALKYMAMAGWDTNQMVDGLSGVMNLAAASGESLGAVSDIVTDALTALGMQASDSARFADILAAAASNSNTNVGMMGETFKYVAPLAGALGYSAEDLAVAIGLMANSGIKASQAGTALRSLFTRLAKPTKDSAEAMDALGLSITNADGTMKPLNQLLLEMRDAFEGLTEAEKTQYAAQLAGQEAMSGLLAIVNSSEDDFNKLTEAIDNSAGSAEEMARIMNDNLKGDITILGSALEGLGIQIYEGFQEPLRRAAQEGIKAVDRLASELNTPRMKKAIEQLAQGFEGLIKTVANLAEKIIPMLVSVLGFLVNALVLLAPALTAALVAFLAYKAISAITSIVSSATTAISALTTALMATNPTILVISALVGIFAAVAIAIPDATSAVSNFRSECEDAASAADDLSQNSENIVKSAKEGREAFNDEAAGAEALADRLGELSSKSKRTASEKEELAGIVSELNSLYPELNLSYSKENDLLTGNTGALKKYIAQKQQQGLLNSYVEESIALTKEQRKVEDQLAQAEARLALAKDTVTDAQNRYDEACRNGLAIMPEMQQEITDAAAAYSSAAQEVEVLTARQGENATEMAHVDEQLGVLAESMEESTSASTELSTATEQTTASMYGLAAAYEELDDTQKATVDSIVSMYETMTGELSSLNQEIKEDSKTTWDTVVKNQDEVIAKTQEFADLYSQLIKMGVSESYLSAIGATGPESIPLLKSMLDAGIDEVRSKQSEWEDAYSGISEALTNSLELKGDTASAIQNYVVGEAGILGNLKSAVQSADFKGIFEPLGDAVGEGTASGIEAATPKAVDATNSMVDDVTAAGVDGFQVNSPSKVFSDIGEGLPEGLAQGVDTAKPKATTSIENLVAEAKNSADTQVRASDFPSVGRAIADGIAEGMRGAIENIASAAREVVSRALAAARTAADAHSPARKFIPLGEDIDAGVALGMERAHFSEDQARALVADAHAATMQVQAGYASKAGVTAAAQSIQNNSGGNIIFEEGAIKLENTQINDTLDAERVSRYIGEKAAMQIRHKGGQVLA